MSGVPQHEALQSLATGLLHISTTSATSERNWFAFRFIHSRLRNRLAQGRVQKLVYIFGNSKLIEDDQEFDDEVEFFFSSTDETDRPFLLLTIELFTYRIY